MEQITAPTLTLLPLSILILILLSSQVGCGKQPVPVQDKTPEVVLVENLSVTDMVMEAKQLGIDGKDVEAALDKGKQTLYDLIQDTKNRR